MMRGLLAATAILAMVSGCSTSNPDDDATKAAEREVTDVIRAYYYAQYHGTKDEILATLTQDSIHRKRPASYDEESFANQRGYDEAVQKSVTVENFHDFKLEDRGGEQWATIVGDRIMESTATTLDGSLSRIPFRDTLFTAKKVDGRWLLYQSASQK